MEKLQGLGGWLGLLARDRDAVAATAQGDVPAIGDLAQVFIQWAAQISKVGIVAVQRDDDRCLMTGGTRHARSPPSETRGTISPWSVLVMAWVKIGGES